MIKEEYPQHQYQGYREIDPGYNNDCVTHVTQNGTQDMTHQQGVISEEEAETEASLLPLQPLSSQQQGQSQPVAMEAVKPRTVFIR